jgi:hypothetical protein
MRANPKPAAINNTRVVSPTSSGKRKEIKPMRSIPKAMLCDLLVRGEPGDQAGVRRFAAAAGRGTH